MSGTATEFIELEHTSGLRPLGEYPDHCDECYTLYHCDHPNAITEKIKTGTGRVIKTSRYCADCGVSL